MRHSVYKSGMTGHLCTAGRQRLTAERIARFLAALARHGNAARAARAAGVGRQTVYDARRTDEQFAAAWASAVAASRASSAPGIDRITLATAARIQR